MQLMTNTDEQPAKTTHFGFEEIPIEEKAARVGQVFDSVADKYDLMNDLMSAGLHRLWKRFAIQQLSLRQGHHVLDLAGGTGDLTKLIHAKIGRSGRIVMADINASMLHIAYNKLLDQGISHNIEFIRADAQQLPFASNQFDRLIIGFGLRNVTDKEAALRSLYRCLKPGGKLLILEFSKPTLELLNKLYDIYSFHILPKIGRFIAKDEDSYRYLAESIRRHPDQGTLKHMMEQAEFENCDYHNLSGGIVALHTGYKY